MIDMTVVGLALDSGTKAPILVLRTREGEEVLPLWIGGVEAMSISLALSNTRAERPLTHDLLISVLHSLNASIVGVNITDVRDGIFYAVLDVLCGDRFVSVDCRPSDAIALALRTQAPIRATESVLARAPRERYLAAVSGQSLVPDESGSIVLRSLKQVEQMIDATTRSKDRHADEVRKPAGPEDREAETDAGRAAEEDELFARMLRDLEPASKYRM